ncbi:MAG: hypothetical protein ACK559_27530, partial [bacterium]
MRMVQRHGAGGTVQGLTQLEARIIGQQRAGQHGRARRAPPLHHHARAGAHQAVRASLQDAPAGGGDLRHIRRRIHLREEHQRHRISGIDRDGMGSEEAGKAGAHPGLVLILPGKAGPRRDMHGEAGAGEPAEALQRLDEAALLAFAVMALGLVMVEA